MQINLIHPGQPVADFAISGSTVTVGGYEIDCAARQQDVAIIIEIRRLDGVVYEGDQGAYLAQIEIPARRYTEPEQESKGESDGESGDEQSAVAPTPESLDTNAVVITLWPTV